MPSYRFYQVDVFTDRAFGGNPLAIFPDADGLDDAQMQTLAREMNLSETTFVFPPQQAEAAFKVRIFTPEMELPFAGHPVVGTHWLLAHLGRVPLNDHQVRVTLELGVGLRSATLHVEQGTVRRVVMDHQKPAFFACADEAQVVQLARGLGAPPAAILETGLPVQVVSTGIKQLFVPMRSLADVRALQPARQDAAQINNICVALDPETHCGYCTMVFCLEVDQAGGIAKAQVHARMFAPGLRIPEDPATGSASGGLGAYLIEHGALPATLPTTSFTVEQGLEMDRPSRIDIEVDGTPGAITMVRVGGQVVPLIEGTVAW